MNERSSPRQFHEAAGVEDWWVVFGGACAHFRTGSFVVGVALVDAIGRFADAANQHPDIDLRYGGVTVLLPDHDGGFREHDVRLAQRISAAARELGVPADSTAVQTVQVTIDALVGSEVIPFWRAPNGPENIRRCR